MYVYCVQNHPKGPGGRPEQRTGPRTMVLGTPFVSSEWVCNLWKSGVQGPPGGSWPADGPAGQLSAPGSRSDEVWRELPESSKREQWFWVHRSSVLSGSAIYGNLESRGRQEEAGRLMGLLASCLLQGVGPMRSGGSSQNHPKGPLVVPSSELVPEQWFWALRSSVLSGSVFYGHLGSQGWPGGSR